MTASKEYEIGFGKPPKAHQFKSGQSGNPNGRPKGAKNLSTLLATELASEVLITEHGKTRKVSKLHVLVKRLVHDAINGNHKAQTTIVAEERRRETIETQATAGIEHSSQADNTTKESLLARLRLQVPPLISKSDSEFDSPIETKLSPNNEVEK